MDIKYLIENEEVIDWDELSADPETSFSKLEMKLFKHRINWNWYIFLHPEQVDDEIMDFCKKDLSPSIISFLIRNNILSEEFLLKNPDLVNYYALLTYYNCSEDTLLELKPYWEKIPNLKTIIERSHSIDITKPEYNKFRLLYEAL